MCVCVCVYGLSCSFPHSFSPSSPKGKGRELQQNNQNSASRDSQLLDRPFGSPGVEVISYENSVSVCVSFFLSVCFSFCLSFSTKGVLFQCVFVLKVYFGQHAFY